MTSPLIDTRTVIEPTTGEPLCTHIVVPNGDDATGIESVMKARIYGTPVTALCGHTWVPSRDPQAFPLCSRCREIREAARPDQDPTEIPS